MKSQQEKVECGLGMQHCGGGVKIAGKGCSPLAYDVMYRIMRKP
jgi:hypothetical protein